MKKKILSVLIIIIALCSCVITLIACDGGNQKDYNNSNRVKQLKILLKNENVIGGEMEGAGIALALDETRIDYIVIKAICDWGYNKDNRKDEYQKHAARNSAMFLYDFFCGDALRKVYRAKIYNYEKIEHLMINGIKLFWHRQNMRMTYEKLLIKLNKKNFRNIKVLLELLLKDDVKHLKRLKK